MFPSVDSADAAITPIMRGSKKVAARNAVAADSLTTSVRSSLPPFGNGALAMLDGCAVAAVVGVLAYALNRSEASFFENGVGWFVFAPVVVALRHGFAKSLAFAGLLVLVLAFAWFRLAAYARFPVEAIFGLVVLSVLVGRSTDGWRRRLASFARDTVRASVLARSHALLEISHDRLSDQMERSQSSLRDATTALLVSVDPAAHVSFRAQGHAMLEIFATYCGLEMGELFIVTQNTLRGRCAVLGTPPETRSNDPLLACALATGRLTYVPALGNPTRGRSEKSALLAAVPFVDALGATKAVLCVHAMPFMAFHKKNLEAMSTLGGNFADLSHGDSVETISRSDLEGDDASNAVPVTLRTPR
ncbi:MAG: hypothetical protein FWD69_16100 [Polyangiaceae bacterium]|nr:hypothetical protein [Polyangiaceae bacterium]